MGVGMCTRLVLAGALVAVAGCDLDAPVYQRSYVVAGEVSGLADGAAIVLRINGADDLVVDRNGAFRFPTLLADGSGYSVSVAFDPSRPAQHCGVEAGAGTIDGRDVHDVRVFCSTSSFRVGGTVAGLAAGNTLELRNGGDHLTVETNGDFTFATPLPDGSPYDVKVAQLPTSPNQSCAVERGDGWIDGADALYTFVTCTTRTYTVGGTVTGLGPTSTVVLRITGGETVSRTTDGSFVFPTPRPDGSAYTVTVQSHPSDPRETCSVSNGSGTLSGANVTNVVVDCSGYADVAVGPGYICGVLVTGELFCAGAIPDPTPTGSGFVEVAAGHNHACALRADGSLVCWGNNLHGQTDAPAGNDFAGIAAGYWKSCALRTDGTIVCWGSSASYPSGSGYTSVDLTDSLGCALGPGGTVTCWSYPPTPPAGVTFQQVTVGQYHVCGIALDGSIRCWGNSNTYGQLDAPAGNDFVDIDAGADHSCAVRADGTLTCWGDDAHGEATAPGGAYWREVSAGPGLSAAISEADGNIYYWGWY